MPRGYNAMADVIKTTADGIDVNKLFDEFTQTVGIRNERMTAIQRLFTHSVTVPAEAVLQTTEDGELEEASEFGVPTALRAPEDLTRFGYGFKWMDRASRFTWLFLAEASAAQVEAAHSAVLDADARTIFKAVMRSVLTKTTIATRPVNEDGVPIYALYDGETDSTPPEYAGQSFAPGHQHYLTTGSAVIDGVDLRDLLRHVTHHGYGTAQGERMVVMCNPSEAETIANFRVANGAPYDFIASDDAPAYLTQDNLVGQRPSGDFDGLRVIGSYADALICPDYLMPSGYVVAVAVAGLDNARNVVGFREHANTALRGLRLVGGSSEKYPLADSTYNRGFGTGVRHRGAAAVMQVTANASYTTPAGF